MLNVGRERTLYCIPKRIVETPVFIPMLLLKTSQINETFFPLLYGRQWAISCKHQLWGCTGALLFPRIVVRE